MTKPAVLCIDHESLKNLKTIEDLKESHLHFLNRNLVDRLEDTSIGEMFPQIIPSIVIQVGNRYLTYARNGNETRLHGSRSMTLGGHIDIGDYKVGMFTTITDAAAREVYEESGISTWFDFNQFTDIIYTPVNPVSKVHVGLYTVLRVEESEVFNPSEELNDIMFLTKEELQQNLDYYEEWSKYIINNLI